MASNKINMDPTDPDPNYRYKFDRLVIKQHGQNTGKITNMVNIFKISNDILGVKMDEHNDRAHHAHHQCSHNETIHFTVTFCIHYDSL